MYANKATAQLMGYSPDAVVGKNFLPFIAADRIEETAEHFGRVAQGHTVQYETAIVTADGRRVEMHITVIPILVDGVVRGVHCIGKDITEVTRMRQALHDLAYRDAVTGLSNSNALLAALGREIAAGTPFDVLEIDLDRLKVVNDT